MAALEQRLADASAEQQLVAVTVACESTDPLQWLAQLPETTRTYWRGREGRLEIAGCGAALQVIADRPQRYGAAFAQMTEALDQLPAEIEAHWLGGLCYDSARASDQLWSEFPPLWFVLPEIALTRHDKDYFLTLTVRQTDAAKLARLEERLHKLFAGEASTSRSQVAYSRTDLPQRAGWLAQIEAAQQAMKRSMLDKVVLARRSDLELNDSIDPAWLAEKLRLANGSGYTFMLQPKGGDVFLGAPPERLFKLRGRELFSEAIAGTRPIGADESESKYFADELRASRKDSDEHGFVVEAIKQSLAPLCDRLEAATEPEILRLGTVQHLRLPLAGKLNPEVGVVELLQALHPTPAVGGSPRAAALEFIREQEPFARGWYAAPVGYLGRDACEFAVAIRSALLRTHQVSLFAGAGIVAASDPEAEWQELEQKIVAPLSVLGESR